MEPPDNIDICAPLTKRELEDIDIPPAEDPNFEPGWSIGPRPLSDSYTHPSDSVDALKYAMQHVGINYVTQADAAKLRDNLIVRFPNLKKWMEAYMMREIGRDAQRMSIEGTVRPNTVDEQLKADLEYRREQELLEFKRGLVEAYGGDRWPVGTVFTFQKRWDEAGSQYGYAVLKTHLGLWYMTGGKSIQGSSWDELVLWLVGGKFPVQYGELDLLVTIKHAQTLLDSQRDELTNPDNTDYKQRCDYDCSHCRPETADEEDDNFPQKYFEDRPETLGDMISRNIEYVDPREANGAAE